MNETTEMVIEAEGVGTRLGGAPVHDGLDLRVPRGEVVALVGGSGSGKTVLLREIIGLQRPSEGVIRVFGVDLAEATGDQWADLRARWGVLFQRGALFTNLTVADNVAFPLRELGGIDRGLIDEIAHRQIAAVGLDPDDGSRLPAELSGGMVKRAALARALILEPELLLLDEPTSGLDPASKDAFVRLLNGLREQLGLTVLLVTHDLDVLSDVCDRVAMLADGTVVESGSPADMARSADPRVQRMFGRGQARARDGDGPRRRPGRS